MKFKIIDFRETARVARTLCRDAVMSPLRTYVIYSVVLHVLFIGLLSFNMILPHVAPQWHAARMAAAATTTTTTSTTLKTAKPAESRPADKPADAATGKKDDYYKREGIDTAPAKTEEIPKNPFDARDELDKGLNLKP